MTEVEPRNRRLRWGLLSTARINARIIAAIRSSKHSEVVAVASSDREKGERYARQWHIPRAYSGYHGLLQDPQVDVIYVSLPNSCHAEWSIKCADAGKHVLCEKPLALTVDEVDLMTDAARRNNVLLQEAAMCRYHPQTLKVQELVRQGCVGELRLIRSVFTISLSKENDIRWDSRLGGGSLWDLGTYPVTFSRAIAQANPVEVMAWQVLNHSGVDLTFTAQMRFANGMMAQFTSSFDAAPQDEAELIGTRGIIHLDLPWVNRVGVPAHVRVLRKADGPEEEFGDSKSNFKAETLTYENCDAYRSEVDAMAASIVDGAPPALPLSDSWGNVATIVALYQSARENLPVRL